MSILSRLFGKGGTTKETASAKAESSEPVDYKGFTIVAAPLNEEGQWRVAGTIEKDAGDERLQRSFVRADLCMSRDEAVEVSRRKAQQIIDQNPRLFDNPEDTSPV